MIIITGQTGTGKTSLALKMAKEHNGVLISADSRQIYQEMDLGTGKVDHPADLVLSGTTWQLKGIPIHGINLISPTEIFSAGDFAEYAKSKVTEIKSQGKTPILVGGTGFYLKSLAEPDETVFIPQNAQLRNLLEKLPVVELQDQLLQKDPIKFESMNNSDRNNPRRLVRAIEVAEWKIGQPLKVVEHPSHKEDIQWIGLHATKEQLASRITHRVDQMITNGLEEEVALLSKKYSWNAPGLQTIGYKEWRPYFEKTQSLEEVKKNIVTSHLQYARRQMIYLKRLDAIEWQEIEDKQP